MRELEQRWPDWIGELRSTQMAIDARKANATDVEARFEEIEVWHPRRAACLCAQCPHDLPPRTCWPNGRASCPWRAHADACTCMHAQERLSGVRSSSPKVREVLKRVERMESSGFSSGGAQRSGGGVAASGVTVDQAEEIARALHKLMAELTDMRSTMRVQRHQLESLQGDEGARVAAMDSVRVHEPRAKGLAPRRVAFTSRIPHRTSHIAHPTSHIPFDAHRWRRGCGKLAGWPRSTPAISSP